MGDRATSRRRWSGSLGSRPARTADGRLVIGLAVALATAICAARLLAPQPSDAPIVLFVVPIALCAVRFGLRGGTAAAASAVGLTFALTLVPSQALSFAGYGSRAAALLFVGILVGSFADRGDQLEEELAPHQNLSRDLIVTTGFDGVVVTANRAWEEVLGYTPDELRGRPLTDFVHTDDREATLAERARIAALGVDAVNFQNRYRHRDGSYRWLEWMVRPHAGTATFYAIARDITERKASEDSLRLLLDQLAIIQRAIAERSRLDEILDTIVRAAASVLGCEIVGLRMIDENDPSYVVLVASTGVDEKLTRVMRRGPVAEGIGGRAIVEQRLLITNAYGTGEGDIQVLASHGLRAAMAAPVYGHGAVVGSLVVATQSDHQFTEAEGGTLAFFAEYAGVALSTARAADAVRQALSDPLTGLPNRALFVDRLEHAVARASRTSGRVAVLFLDLDGFKLVNDSLGHLAGDRLLIEVAKRIRACLPRSTTAARFGGDEFAVLLPDGERAQVPEIVGTHIADALSAPFQIDGHELRVRASIGLATGRDDPEGLLRDADIAMYRAKASKRGGLCIFEPGMQSEIVRDLELRNELLRAVAMREITVAYQPIVSLEDGGIAAFEALARWTHPVHGPVSPEVFIPLAESAGVIHEIGAFVLHTACRDVAAWRAAHPAHGGLQVTVNVSPDQLGQALVDDIELALRQNRLPAGALVLELTETNLLHDSETALALLAQLRRTGIQIAIDDFGTGYSSLRYLRTFPVDVLKIAKPFVDGVEQEDGWAFARLITDLATTLGLVTVAEGIEAAGQHDRLVGLGCAYGQGYLYSPPVGASEVAALLADAAARQWRRAA